MTNKDNEIILCKGIKLDRNYENVLSYSESDMVTLCRNNAIYQADEYNFIEKANNRIVVSHPYSSAMYSNYVAFKNPRFGNKWIFAWVTDVKLINVGSTEITFEVDVWSTWYSRFSVGKAFIEREHVDDDTIGKHTIPEGLETGEIIQSGDSQYIWDTGFNCYICVAVTEVPSNMPNVSDARKFYGVYSGLYYILFQTSTSVSSFIHAYDELSKADAINSVFLVPSDFLPNPTWYTGTLEDYTFTFTPLVESDYARVLTPINANPTVTMPTTIGNNFSPKNNKLFTWPYNYFYISNHVGSDVVFKYEDFLNNTPSFKVIGSVTPGCSIKCIPLNYKNTTDTQYTYKSYNYGINAGKYPVCSWNSDTYTNWLTQNGVNVALGAVTSTFNVVAGAMLGSPTMMVSGAAGVANSMTEMYKHSLVPDQVRGNTNSGDVTYSAQELRFTAYRMSIRNEYAASIDSYFSRFGYKVNEVKQPNLNSRTQFNFIKVGGMDELIHGDIPSTDLEKINEICRKGVTIFHNYTNFGNYTISNPIVS